MKNNCPACGGRTKHYPTYKDKFGNPCDGIDSVFFSVCIEPTSCHWYKMPKGFDPTESA